MKERAQQLAKQGQADDVGEKKQQSGQTVTEKPSHTSRLFKEQTANTAHSGGESHFAGQTEGQSPHEIMSSVQLLRRVT